MNKFMWIKALVVFCCLVAFQAVYGAGNDSINTEYKNAEFVTRCQIMVNASDSVCSAVFRDFNYQMCYKLDGLFGWALKGMNLRKEKKELMMFYFKSTSFDKSNNIIKGVGDVIVPGVITIPDIVVNSKLSSRKLANGRTAHILDMVGTNGFIKTLNTTFFILPAKGKANYFTMEARVKFGWFFDFFITQSRYRQILEWRLKRFATNLRDEAEKRQHALQNNKLNK